MIALAGNFYIFASRITARLAAVLLALGNIAAAWNVCAFLVLLVYHATPPIDTVLDSQFSAALNAAVLRHGRTIACRVAIRAGTGFLCILVAIKIPSGVDKQSGFC